MKSIVAFTAMGLGLLVSAQIQAESAPIAGLHPYERPAGAPVQTERPVTRVQLGHWMHGISEPYPGNVTTIAASGHWWLPLRGPGMTPPYDLRAWHGIAPLPSSVYQVSP